MKIRIVVLLVSLAVSGGRAVGGCPTCGFERGYGDPADSYSILHERCWTDPATGIRWMFWACDGVATLGNPNFNILRLHVIRDHQTAVPRTTAGRVIVPREVPVEIYAGTTNMFPVVGINRYAFYTCTNLTEIVVPDGVREIGVGAFYGCSRLEKLTLPFIGRSPEQTTQWTHGYQFRVGEGYVPEVPRSLKEYVVTGTTPLPEGAFSGLETLERLTLPEGLAAIPRDICSGADALREVNIPSTVTSIGEYAFAYTSLAEATLPAHVTSFGDAIFVGCRQLARLTVEEGVGELPSGVVANCHALKTVVIPPTVTNIARMALLDCTALEEVRIPASVKNVGLHSFLHCTSLARTCYSGSLVDWFSISFESADANPLYNGGELITSDGVRRRDLQLPEGVDTLNLYALDALTNRTTVALPSTLTHIPAEAFAGQGWLKTIEIPSRVTSVGDRAFARCTGLSSVTWSPNTSEMGDAVFSCCTNLTSVTIPAGVTALGTGTFTGCTKLKTLAVPEGIVEIPDRFCSHEPVVTNRTQTGSSSWYVTYDFYGPNLTSFVIPSTVRRIGANAFYYNSLATLGLPSRLEEIGPGAFCGNPIASLKTPPALRTIGDGAFMECRSLVSVQLNEALVSIGSSAFAECRSLASLQLNEGLESIGSSAFRYCQKLKSFTTPSTVSNLGSQLLYECAQLERIDLTCRIAKLPDDLCHWNTNLTEVVYSDDVRELGRGTFYGCTRLKHVKVPAQATSIPADCFSSCYELDLETLPGTVTNIGRHAFGYAYWRTNGRALILPDSVERIEEQAFYNCHLVKLTIGRGVKSIGDSAFDRCDIRSFTFLGDKPEMTYNVIDYTVSKYSGYSGCYYATFYVSRRADGWGDVPGTFEYLHNLDFRTLPIQYIPCEHEGTEAGIRVEPTCTEAGREPDTVCTSCDAVVAAGAPIPALGHTEDAAGKVVKAPTAFETGEKAFLCVRCGIEMRRVELPRLPLDGDSNYASVMATIEPSDDAERRVADTFARIAASKGSTAAFEAWCASKVPGEGALASRLVSAPYAEADFVFDQPLGRFAEEPSLVVSEFDPAEGFVFKVKAGAEAVVIQKLNAVVSVFAASSLNGLEDESNRRAPAFEVQSDGSVRVALPEGADTSGFYKLRIGE